MNSPQDSSSLFRRYLVLAALATLVALLVAPRATATTTPPQRRSHPRPSRPRRPRNRQWTCRKTPPPSRSRSGVTQAPRCRSSTSSADPPVYWLTVGGTLYAEGPIQEIWPPALMPNLLETTVDNDAFDAVLEDIADSTLPDVDEVLIREPTGLLADGSITEFVLRDASGEHVIRVEGLDAGAHTDPRVTSLTALMDKLGDATESVAFYRGDRLQVIVAFGIAPPFPEDQDDRPWPLAEPPARTAEGGFPCHVFDGAEAARLQPLFAAASVATRWLWEDERLYLIVRELLPGEAGCR